VISIIAHVYEKYTYIMRGAQTSFSGRDAPIASNKKQTKLVGEFEFLEKNPPSSRTKTRMDKYRRGNVVTRHRKNTRIRF